MRYITRKYVWTTLLAIAFGFLLWLSPAIEPVTVKAYDGSIDQTADHSNEASMYRYSLLITVDNPINTKDADKDALEECWFKFYYKSENGYGPSKDYKVDMSWSGGRNPYPDYVKLFKKPNDSKCKAIMDVWVPGILTKIDFHLNMAGGERLRFDIDEVKLNGYLINTTQDYVTSAYYDSDGKVECLVPFARCIENGNGKRDQYNGLLGDTFLKKYNDNTFLYGY